MALGSGFMISPDGYIVTNNHVVANAAEIHVRLMDKTDVPAAVVGRDPEIDIAVLKIDPQPGIAVASWGDSDAVAPGAWTIAIGSPFGLGGTVTVGVLSARSRDIRSGPYDDYLQTDAAINRGNSGGPLFNVAGEVIGVNTAIYSPSGGSIGIGFAVPSRTARAAVDQIIRTGHVERGFIGLRLQDVTPPIAQALGRPNQKGALVAGVEHGAPAEAAGVSSGDIVTALNNRPVENGRDLSRGVADLKPGSRATLGILHNDEQRDVTVTIAPRREPSETRTGSLPADADSQLGLALGPIPEELRSTLDLGTASGGVLVQQVRPGSPAADSGLQSGDVILSANNLPVNAPQDVARAWNDARQRKRPVLLGVQRDRQSMFIAVSG